MSATNTPETPKQSEVGSSIVCFVAGAIALGIAVWLLWMSWENLRSGSWPRTNGTVESAQIMRKVKSRGGIQFTAEFRYAYTVDGTVYKGDRFNTRGNYLSDEATAYKVVEGYSPGGPISVAYNPRDPSSSFIDTTITWHTWGKLIIGGIMGLVALMFFFFGGKGLFGTSQTATRPIVVPNRPEHG